jgi:hypothetical protein
MVLPAVHLLSCAERAASLAATLRSWDCTDWGIKPRVHLDAGEPREGEEWGAAIRARRVTEAYAMMLRTVVAAGGRNEEWLLLLNDDLEFHPCLAALFGSWSVPRDPGCVLASLFNSPLAKVQHSGVRTRKSDRHQRAAPVDPTMFLCAQAVLVRFWAVKWVLARWNSMPGLPAQRLARLLGGVGPIWVHEPSLVQHVAPDSSWGAKVYRAADFDPGWIA